MAAAAALTPALAGERERFFDFQAFVDVDAAALLDTLGAHLTVALPPMLQISPPLLLLADGFLEDFDEDFEPAFDFTAGRDTPSPPVIYARNRYPVPGTRLLPYKPH